MTPSGLAMLRKSTSKSKRTDTGDQASTSTSSSSAVASLPSRSKLLKALYRSEPWTIAKLAQHFKLDDRQAKAMKRELKRYVHMFADGAVELKAKYAERMRPAGTPPRVPSWPDRDPSTIRANARTRTSSQQPSRARITQTLYEHPAGIGFDALCVLLGVATMTDDASILLARVKRLAFVSPQQMCKLTPKNVEMYESRHRRKKLTSGSSSSAAASSSTSSATKSKVTQEEEDRKLAQKLQEVRVHSLLKLMCYFVSPLRSMRYNNLSS